VGTDVAIDAAHVVLMREDWALVPHLFRTANRTMRVVKGNFVFTGIYNLLALGLAAIGWIPPVVAAAMHSIPDLGILANSSRLLRRSAK
jgi:cation transport ATPase